MIVDDLELLITETSQVDKGTILHLHGLPGGQLESFKELHQLLTTRGYRVISFNYPGLWNASGHFSIESSLQATNQVISYIEKTYNEIPRVFAESYGGYVISKLAGRNVTVSHIFFRAPLPGFSHYLSSQNLQNQLLQSLVMMNQAGILDIGNKKMLELLPEESLDDLKNIIFQISATTKMMVCIGKDDEIIPVDRVKEIFDTCANLQIFEHMPHNNLNREMWIELITRADILFQS